MLPTTSGEITPLSQGLTSGGIEFSTSFWTCQRWTCISYTWRFYGSLASHMKLSRTCNSDMDYAKLWRGDGKGPIPLEYRICHSILKYIAHDIRFWGESVMFGVRCDHFCYKCGWKWLCVDKGCYELHHTPRRFQNQFQWTLQNSSVLSNFWFPYFLFPFPNYSTFTRTPHNVQILSMFLTSRFPISCVRLLHILFPVLLSSHIIVVLHLYIWPFALLH
jgi:hypothetical protein